MAVIKNVHVVDVRDGRVREGHVRLEGGSIREVGTGQSADADAIDLEGAYLLPGLISCHTHLSIVFPFSERNPNESPAITALRCHKRAMDTLQAGITTIRTVAELHRADIALRTMIERGWAEGPRILSAGRAISTTGGHGSGFGAAEADGGAEFLKAARQELAAGANHIKIFITGGIAHRGERLSEPQTTMEEMQGAVAAARSKDTYVVRACRRLGTDPAGARGRRALFRARLSARSRRRPWRCAGRRLPRADAAASPARRQFMKSQPVRGLDDREGGVRGPRSSRQHPHRRARRRQDHQRHRHPARATRTTASTSRCSRPSISSSAGLSPLDSLRASSIRAAELIGLSSEVGAIEPGYAADLDRRSRQPARRHRGAARDLLRHAGRPHRPPRSVMKPYRIAVDIGGTFVDALQFDRRTQTIRLEKASTTPAEPAAGRARRARQARDRRWRRRRSSSTARRSA